MPEQEFSPPAHFHISNIVPCLSTRVCTQSDTVGGSMHIVGLRSVNTHKEEKTTTYFFQANILDEAVTLQEYVFKCKD